MNQRRLSMNEEIIRLIGNTIEDGLEAHDLLHDIAEAILNMTYPCPNPKCDKGVIGYTTNLASGSLILCPICKGTGLSPDNVLAILSRDQTPPKNPHEEYYGDKFLADGKLGRIVYSRAQLDMISQGWRKTV
jgi:hypothetical protein